MPKNVIDLPKLANPTIESILTRYLSESSTGKESSDDAREEIVELLMSCMNSYSYSGLSAEESKFFDRHFNAPGDKQKEFCQIFGADKMADGLDYFVTTFLIRKLMGSRSYMARASREIGKLAKWLGKKGCISVDESKSIAATAARAAKVLPIAEKAAAMLWERGQTFDVRSVANEGYFEITKVGTGKLWLTPSNGRKPVGPIAVPAKASELIEPGWVICCAIAKVKGAFQIVEVGTIAPTFGDE